MPCRLGPRGRRRSDLNGQQNRTVSPARFRSSRLPSPCEEQALRNAVSPRHLAHHGPRHQRLFNDPRLLVLAPTPSALDPENLPIHLCMTLRLAQRSHPSRRTPSQQGGRRRTDTPFLSFVAPNRVNGRGQARPRRLLLHSQVLPNSAFPRPAPIALRAGTLALKALGVGGDRILFFSHGRARPGHPREHCSLTISL